MAREPEDNPSSHTTLINFQLPDLLSTSANKKCRCDKIEVHKATCIFKARQLKKSAQFLLSKNRFFTEINRQSTLSGSISKGAKGSPFQAVAVGVQS